jgi:putative Holliday junction resolvase
VSETSYPRILGVDYGSHRVGLSLSDPLGIIARPVDAVKNDAQLFANLKQFAQREHVQLIIVGMPFNLKGERARKAEEVQHFVDRLSAELKLEVKVWDERFTTSIARQTMIDMGTKKKERRQHNGRVDSMAAAVILQGFLDSTKHSRSC